MNLAKADMRPGGDATHVGLAGATGYIGRAVAEQLVSKGHAVSALVRDASAVVPGCSVISTDLGDPESISGVLASTPVDALISCIASRTGAPKDAWNVDYQANVHLLKAALAAGAKHFVLLSAICVQKPRLAFQYAKLAFEKELRKSGIDYTIVRPTAFFKSLSGQIERVRNGKPFLLFGDGEQTACKPISEADLAEYIVDCLGNPEKRNRVLPIGGPGAPITPREQGELLFELTGREPRFRNVPPGMFTVASAILEPLSKLIPPLGAKAEFARIGHYYATESMLVWDAERGCYDADATPSTGTITLRDHYERILSEGMAGQEAGEHKLF